MSVTDRESGQVTCCSDIMPDPARMHPNGLARPASAGPPNGLTAGLKESLGRVAALAAAALSTPNAAAMLAGTRALYGLAGAPGTGDRQSPCEQLLCADVVGSGDKLIIGDTRLDRRISNKNVPGAASMIAWAGVPVRDQDGRVAGALWVADRVPRLWSATDVVVLAALAEVASIEAGLRAALALSAGRVALARTLEESLLPPPQLPDIPGLQVAVRYAASGTGTDVLADFCDVFPSVGGTWGMVVGDVCGKGSAAAKGTALARHTLRALARSQTRPSLLLAHLNQILLDWPTDDPRFLTAIYAAVRPVRGGVRVRISSAGHPLALVHAANGHVREFGRPGVLLGVLARPELHDSQRLLRPGDSLIMFSDGVTEARGDGVTEARGDGVTVRDLFGDERLRRLVARLDDMTAAAIADAIQLAALTFSGGRLSDDTVALVMKVPALARRPPSPARLPGCGRPPPD
jgi:phosphoserine phosphatase RsbU/P